MGGQTFHWSNLSATPRQAMSVRFIAADMLWTEELALGGDVRWYYGSYFPWLCRPVGESPIYPIVSPRNMSTLDAIEPWPLWPRAYDLMQIVMDYRYDWASSHSRTQYRACEGDKIYSQQV